MEIIPTKHKEKIPKGFSYPIGAKEPIRIIQVEYQRSRIHRSTPKDWAESGYCDPRWSIRIYGLPSEYRAETKKQLIENALPRIREWLIKIGNIEDFSYKQKSFAVDLSTCKLINN